MPQNNAEKTNKNSRKKKAVLIIFLIAIITGGYFAYQWIIFRINYVSTDDAQVKGDLIGVSPRIPGKILQMSKDEGHKVQKGELLSLLDETEYRASYEKAVANHQNAKEELSRAISQLSLTQDRINKNITEAHIALSQSNENLELTEKDLLLQEDILSRRVEKSHASLRVSESKLIEKKANLDNAEKEYQRAKILFEKGAISENRKDQLLRDFKAASSQHESILEEIKEAESAFRLARAELRAVDLKKQQVKIARSLRDRAKVSLELAEAEKLQIDVQKKTIDALKAKVKEAESQIKLVKSNLDETKIVSPVSGIIAKRISNTGEFVQPGQPLYFIVNPKSVWVIANIEETYIRKVREGSEVDIKVDAFPGKRFQGKVETVGSASTSQFSLIPSDNPSGQFVKVTQRIPVRIIVDDRDSLLKPGMMVVVAIQATKQ